MNEHWTYNKKSMSFSAQKRPTTEMIKKRSEITKWLKTLYDSEISDLNVLVYDEGRRRGFGNYWQG